MSENKERCETCRFWLLFDDNPKDMAMGYCRRYPPIPSPWEDENDDPILNLQPETFLQPMTYLDEWCGEYQLRADSQNG